MRWPSARAAGEDWILEEDETKPVIDRALDLGINFFDTSDYYSGGESEAVLGRCLFSRVGREQVVIATKVGNPMGPSVTERGYSRKHITHAVDASLKRLGTDYIELYQTHIWDPETDLEEMVIAFDDLIRAGKILHAGITTMPAWQLAKCLSIAHQTGRRPFASAQNHYNLVHWEDEREFIPLCRSEGMALIPLQPAGPWIPVRRPGRRRWPHPAGSNRRVHPQVARPPLRLPGGTTSGAHRGQAGPSPAQVALAWVLSRPGIDAPLFGATRVEHVEEAVEALSVTLTPTEVRSLEAAYEPKPLAGTVG